MKKVNKNIDKLKSREKFKNDEFKKFLNFENFKKCFLFVFVVLFLIFNGQMTYLNLKFKSEKGTLNFDTYGKNIFQKDRILKAKRDYKEKRFCDNFHNRIFYVEKYGKLQRLFKKKIVDDKIKERRVYKGSEGMLYYIVDRKDINHKAVKAIDKIKDELFKSDIPLAFVMTPNKHTLASETFPYGVLDYSTTNSDNLEQKLDELGVPTINLSKEYYKDGLSDEENFYKTDIHWKNQGAFWGYQKVFEFLKTYYMMEFYNKDNSNILSNYKTLDYKNSFIGTMGKSTGKDYISKKDEYSLILPEFKTDFEYLKYDEDYNLISDTNGDFERVFVNKNILNSGDIYEDKYKTLMGDETGFQIIKNKKINDDSKIVIIKDSFAMPLVAYLANNIEKIYLFDTKYENIRNTMVSRIKMIDPDIVLFIESPNSIFYYNDMFNF